MRIAHRKREREAGHAEHTANRLEWEAGFAIDYAVASIEQAELAVLDAIAGRVEAEEAKRAVQADAWLGVPYAEIVKK